MEYIRTYNKDNNLKRLVEEIEYKYREIVESVDKKTKEVKYSCHYSTIVVMMPSQVDKIKKLFPKFHISPVYGQYYLIVFNKPSNWIEESLKKLEI